MASSSITSNITQSEILQNVTKQSYVFLTFPLTSVIKDDKIMISGGHIFGGKVVMATNIDFESDKKEGCEIISRSYLLKFLHGSKFTLGKHLATGTLSPGSLLPGCNIYPFTHAKGSNLDLTIEFQDVEAVNLIKEHVNITVNMRVAELKEEFAVKMHETPFACEWFNGASIEFKNNIVSVIEPLAPKKVEKLSRLEPVAGIKISTPDYNILCISEPHKDGVNGTHTMSSTALMALCAGNDIAIYDETVNLNTKFYSTHQSVYEIKHCVARSTDALFDIKFEFPFAIPEDVELGCAIKREHIVDEKLNTCSVVTLCREKPDRFAISSFDMYRQLLLVGWGVYNTYITLAIGKECKDIKSILTKTKVHLKRAMYCNEIRKDCDELQFLTLRK